MKHTDLDALSLMFGCLIGFVFTAFIFVAPLGLDWKIILKEYQDLIAGLVALVAAGFTILVINRQIMQAERLAEDNRRRRGYAARSMMPSALSSMSNYAQQCAKIPLHVIENSTVDEGLLIAQPVANRPPVPLIPAGELSVLRDCIECADEAIQMQIADLISQLQIQNSRLRGLYSEIDDDKEHALTRHYVEELVIDALELYARSSMLFDYARRKTEDGSGEPKLEQMYNAAILFSIRDHVFPEIHKTLNRRYGLDLLDQAVNAPVDPAVV